MYYFHVKLVTPVNIEPVDLLHRIDRMQQHPLPAAVRCTAPAVAASSSAAVICMERVIVHVPANRVAVPHAWRQ